MISLGSRVYPTYLFPFRLIPITRNPPIQGGSLTTIVFGTWVCEHTRRVLLLGGARAFKFALGRIYTSIFASSSRSYLPELEVRSARMTCAREG
jgi:hypothetical protein